MNPSTLSGPSVSLAAVLIFSECYNNHVQCFRNAFYINFAKVISSSQFNVYTYKLLFSKYIMLTHYLTFNFKCDTFTTI